MHSIELLAQEMEPLQKEMNIRFEAVDKRFEAMDKRFSDLIHHMDKRFASVQWLIGVGFTILAVLMAVFKFIK